MTLSIGTLNAQGLNNALKRQNLKSFISAFNPAILAIQETNIDPNIHDILSIPSFLTFHSPSTTTIGSGLAFLVCSDLNVLDHKVLIPGKMSSLSIFIHGQNLHFINVHF